MRDLVIFLLGILIGIGIGYFGESIIKPYVSTYNFPTTLTLTTNINSTIVPAGETVTFKAVLETKIPSELQALEQQIRQFVLNNKPITLLMKEGTAQTYWSIVETRNTVYTVNGEVTFSYTFQKVGTFNFKAVFEGDNILSPSESEIITINVM